MVDITTNKEGEKLFLSGNLAIVRGALEAGIDLATTYPGTPASEIGDTYYEIAKDDGMYFEYSVNEKVALEIAAGASFCGLRTMCSMKSVGLNVASDCLMGLTYTGVRGGMVIVCADDPSCHSSQNEQDNRYFARLSGCPMMEPSSPREARDMTVHAYEISEELELPILLRTTTRVNHTSEAVVTGERRKKRREGYFKKDSHRFALLPSVARERHIVLLEQEKKARKISERSPFNKIIGSGRFGIAASGVSVACVREAVKDLELSEDVAILELGMTNPLPDQMTKRFIEGVDAIMVVEELEPYLEEYIKARCFDAGRLIPVYGKGSGHFSRLSEYIPEVVYEQIAKIAGVGYDSPTPKKFNITPPMRPPVLCPGCPHRASYNVVKKVMDKDTVFPNDIGCYALGMYNPFKVADIILCMGAGMGTAQGVSTVSDQKVIAFIGDSTFFHAGLPSLVNAVHNKHNFVLVILDNQTTAMTGLQPHPGTPANSIKNPLPYLLIEDVVRGLGVQFVEVVDPFQRDELEDAYRRALEYNGVAVVIARRDCVLYNKRKDNLIKKE